MISMLSLTQGGMISMQGGMISMQGGMISMARAAGAIMSIKHVGSESIIHVACRKSHVTSQARQAAL
jgi:hypothetical protein